MFVREVQSQEAICCQTGTSIENVVNLMRTYNIGSVVVTKESEPVGFVTDRDIALRCIGNGVEYARHEVQDIMSKSLSVVRKASSVRDAISLMKERSVRRLIIMDEKNKRPIGLLTCDDLLRLLAKEITDLSESIEGSNRSVILQQILV